jgi:hypothetical protein
MNLTPDVEAALASTPLDDADHALLARVRRLYDDADPVPEDLAERSKFAMTVAALEAEVAQIVARPLAGVRTVSYDRASTVTFASERLSVMVSIEYPKGASPTVAGWVSGGATDVELRERARTRFAHVDAEGRFLFADVERGLIHFVLRDDSDPDVAPVITPAIEI